MITDADIKKMKEVFVTKEDLKILLNKLDVTNKTIQENTKDLTDLILAGFSTHDPILSNHEQRITHLEKTTYKAN